MIDFDDALKGNQIAATLGNIMYSQDSVRASDLLKIIENLTTNQGINVPLDFSDPEFQNFVGTPKGAGIYTQAMNVLLAQERALNGARDGAPNFSNILNLIR